MIGTKREANVSALGAQRRTRLVMMAIVVVMALVALATAVILFGTRSTKHVRAAASNGAAVSATLHEWRVDFGRTTLRPGSYTFRIANTGTATHELIAFKLASPATLLPTDAQGNVNEDAPGLVKVTDGDNIVAQATQTRTITISSPGAYIFLCNLPGHYRLGMHTVVTVSS